MLASAVALAVTTLSISLTLIPQAYASSVVPAVQPAPDTLGFHLVRALPAHAVLPLTHTVQSGDTLSGLAVRYCHGNDRDWTGFYHDNKKVVGSNPNLILPGQRLALNRCTDPPSLLHLGSTYHAPRHTATRHAVRHAHRTHRHATVTRAPGTSYRGHYSYAGLEALWISAGGPAWAASHAAEIAECESGGNVYAYNPSGATGLWQILGSVVGGNLYNPYTNALNAVSKFKASGDTFAQWVCR